MLSKVKLMLSLVQNDPGLKIRIFSGLGPGNLYQALAAENTPIGTLISHEDHMPSPGS
jgi:hypothetical protein